MAVPGAGGANDATIIVGAEKNEAEFRQVLTSMEAGFTEVVAKINSQVAAEFAKFAQTAGKHIEGVSPKIKKAATELRDMGTTGENALKGLDKQLASLLTVLTQFNRSAAESVGAMATIREGNRRRSVEITRAAEDSSRAQIEAVRATSHAHTVETQQVTTQERSAALERIQIAKNEGRQSAIAAQRAAKQRVLITQAALQTIGRLEKGLGVTISGAARVASNAFSKIFDHFGGKGGGIVGAVARQNSELNGELGRTESIVSTKTKEINNSFTEGTNTALSRREGLIRNSFREQETIVRQSAVRQAAAIEGLRKETQTGVIGAANRGLNIGAFLGGAAIFTAVRSTFSVGSEFVRGLAVLQTQLGLTADQMKDVHKLAIDLGNDITLPGVSALDAAQAIQILTKQFGSLGPAAVGAAEQAAKGTLQLSRAVGVSAEDAAGIIGAAVNVFKIGADKAVQIADNVAGALAKAAGVSFSDFRDAFVQGATVFEQFVGPAEDANNVLIDFNTTLAVLAKNGITGSNAGAGLKQFFLQATKSSPKATKLSAELAGKVGETGNLFFTASGKARKFDDSLRILRSSLKGLTDQQRNSTLATLFGSRSITIASALINTSQKDYDDLRKSIQQQGLAAKIAAAQNTGFAGALDALKSVIETAQIALYEKVNPLLGKVTLAFAVFFNNILSGKGVWEIIRRGFLGIAAGLGAVLAVKGVVEIFQALSTALTLLLTPMGLFLTAAAAIGAVISILSDKSPAFRDVLGKIRDTLVDLGKRGLVEAERGLQDLVDIITRDVLPFLEEVARVVGGKVLDAFHFVSQFITNTAIPALKKLAEFVERNAVKGWGILVRFFEDKVIPTFKRIVAFVEKAILPKLKALADFVGRELVSAFKILVDFLTGSVYPAIFGIGLAFGPTGVLIAAAASAIIFFWDTIRPILQPAIDGFKTLGDAVKSAFKHDNLDGIGAGLSAAGSGIAKVAGTIAALILGVLTAAGKALVATLKEVFSLAHLIAAGKGFLDFVEFVGNTLGKIVTNPKFVATVAAIGAGLVTAAGLIAFRFLEGFGKAFLHNLPGLAKLIGLALVAALVGPIVLAFKNPRIALEIISGFIAMFAVKNLVRGISGVFEKAGSQAGVGFTQGLFRTIRQGIGRTLATTAGLLGQTKAVNPAQQSAGFFKQQLDQMEALQRKLRVLGSSTTVQLTPKSLKDANDELKKLSANTSDARLKGLLLRDTFSQVGHGLATAFKGGLKTVGQVISGVFRGIGTAVGDANTISASGGTVAKGFMRGFRNSIGTDGRTQFKEGLTQAFQGIRQALVEAGIGLGKAIGIGVVGGLTAAVLAAGAFQGGKAEGKAGGTGILSALFGGLTTVAVLGGPENGFALAAGAVVAATGVIGAAFGRAQKKAEDYTNAVKELADSLTGDLVNAINDGTVAVAGIGDVKIDPGAVFSAGDNQKKLAQSLAAGLPDDVLQKINDQLGQGGLNKVAGFFKEAGGSATKFKTLFSNAMLESGKTAKQLVSIAGGDDGVAANLRQLLTEIAAPGGPASIKDVFLDPKFSNFIDKYPAKTKKVVVANLDLLQSNLSVFTDINTKADQAFEAGKKASDAAFAIADIPKAINDGFEHAGINGLDHATKKISLFQLQIIETALQAGKSTDDIQEAFNKVGLPPIDQTVVDDWQKQLGKVTAAAEAAQQKVSAIPDKIKKIAQDAVTNPTQLLQDSAVVQVKADASGLADAIANSVNHDFDSPEAQLALAQLGDNVSTAVSTAITGGVVTNQASLLTFLQPIIDAAVAAAPTDEQKKKVGEFFTALFTGVSVELPKDAADVAGAKFQADVAQYMKDHPFITPIQAQFVTAANTPLTGDPGTALGTRRAGFVAPTQKSLIDGLLPSVKEVSDKSALVGQAVPVGLANGMKNPEAIAEMIKQSHHLALVTLAQFKLTLGIKSPSAETHDMGLNLAKGLANGIEAGSAHAAKAAQEAAQASLDAANNVLSTGLNPIGGPQFTNPNAPRPGSDPTQSSLDTLLSIAKSLQETAAQMNKRGPDVTNVAIHETKDPRATARSTITALRSERLLQHGLR